MFIPDLIGYRVKYRVVSSLDMLHAFNQPPFSLLTFVDFAHVTCNVTSVGTSKRQQGVTSSMPVTSPLYHLVTAGNLKRCHCGCDHDSLSQSTDGYQLPRLPTFCIDQLDQLPQLRPMASRPLGVKQQLTNGKN